MLIIVTRIFVIKNQRNLNTEKAYAHSTSKLFTKTVLLNLVKTRIKLIERTAYNRLNILFPNFRVVSTDPQHRRYGF